MQCPPSLRPLLLLCLAGAGIGARARADLPYVRQPDLHGHRIVFCAESDLWIATTEGRNVRRLTTHPGNESAPAFSPDGRWIAFSGSYDGNQDVYVIPAAGGEPRRLTWHPGGDEVIDWTPDGDAVVFRSRRDDPHGSQHLYTVDLAGGDPEELPLGWAARIAMDPDSGLWAFCRNNRENRPWKRYRGGLSTDLWVGRPDRADFRKITDFDGMDAFPMWHGGRLWFLSDQGGTANLWSIRPDGTDRTRHTSFDTWDVRWPAMGDDGRIVFTLAADLHVFDPRTGHATRIDVALPTDAPLTRVRYPDAGDAVTELDLSPDGTRLAVVARGEVFSVPVEGGVTLPVTRGTGARERAVVFDPAGERLLFITDESGEEEVRTIDAWGRGTPTVVLPAAAGVWHYQPRFSPDGKWIAWSDNRYRLFVAPAAGGEPREIDRGTEGEIRTYAWSPGGRWLAYAKDLPNHFGSIFLFDTVEGATHPVTGPFTNDRDLAWDPDGRYLYFVSDRQINPLVGELDFDNVEMKNDRLYLVLLREEVANPLRELAGLPPTRDEEKGQEKDEAEDGAAIAENEAKEKGPEGPTAIEIDVDGLPSRVVELPVPLGNYSDLAATSTHLFFLASPVRGLVEAGDFFTPGKLANELETWSLESKETTTFTKNVQGYLLANAGGKIALRRPDGIFVVPVAAPPGPALAKGKVDLSDLVVELDPRREWAQIYREAWRQMREFYWDEGLSGVDWDALGEQYAALLPRLADRADLSDLIGQVFGEMNTSHTYVFGGDSPVRVPRVSTGLLGADLERAGDGAYRIARIYRGSDPDRIRSPLEVPGVGVREGEYVLAVNRRPLAPDRPFHAALEDLAGKAVVLTVNGTPDLEGARDVVVTPLASDADLRYADWVRHNREYVAAKTDGKIGYLHLPDMLNPGLTEFNTWFYPQLHKEGLIVDVRWNGGGSYSQMILERLRRHVLSFDYARGGAVLTYPYRVLNGPFVVLANQNSGSDGDIFPRAVQLEGLAPIIGTRTWGGVVGIMGLRPLVDGGLVTQSQAAWWDAGDGWDLENRGVIPDIEVPALPQDVARGVDRQLDRGIEEVLRRHAEHPPVRPDFPPSRRRAREAFRGELGH